MVHLRTASTCSLVMPGNHNRKSSTETPPSRFSKRAMTGTRVPRKTYDPLTFSESCSTAVQVDQSIIALLYRRPLFILDICEVTPQN